MKLSSAARHFDHQPLLDAYTSSLVGYGQLSLFDGSVRDGTTVERRVISTEPNLLMPPRRVVKSDDFFWIVGDFIPDFFGGSAIRHGYVVHQAQGLATIRTIQQALQNAAGTTAYAAVTWVKSAKEVDESSGMYNSANVILAPGEPLAAGNLVELAGHWYLARSVYTSSAGFLTGISDELPEPVFETVNYTSKVYNPVTDSNTTTTTSVKVLRLRWQSQFEYLSIGSATYERGDLQVMMLKGLVATPKAGDIVPLSEGNHRVLAVLDEGTHVSMHLRRA
jgi:hypothetical protein